MFWSNKNNQQIERKGSMMDGLRKRETPINLMIQLMLLRRIQTRILSKFWLQKKKKLTTKNRTQFLLKKKN